MNSINDQDNLIYQNGLKRTHDIDAKLEKTKINCLISVLALVGTKTDILLHLKGGPAKNLTNAFFKYTSDKCDYCGVQKNKTIQLAQQLVSLDLQMSPTENL